MKRKREEDDNIYSSSERLPSKERKISNDPDGRIRTISIERSSSYDDSSSNRKSSRNVNLIQVHEEYRPNDAAMTFCSGERDITSNGDDSSMLSFNLISKIEADRIYQKLAAINVHGNNLIKRNWTNEEIKLLEFAVDKFCQSSKRSVNTLTTKDWKSIATFIPGRTESQCLYKWKNRVKQKAFTKSTWSTQEDRILCNIVNQYGSKNWPIIANLLNQEMGEPNKRVGKQCRERWLNHLQPSINKSAWTPEEDLVLLQNHKKFSNQWAKIAKFIPGRTENMVKNRFNTISKKKRDELKTMNKFKKPLDEVIEEIEAEENYSNENDEIWIDDMINLLSHQIITNSLNCTY